MSLITIIYLIHVLSVVEALANAAAAIGIITFVCFCFYLGVYAIESDYFTDEQEEKHKGNIKKLKNVVI